MIIYIKYIEDCESRKNGLNSLFTSHVCHLMWHLLHWHKTQHFRIIMLKILILNWNLSVLVFWWNNWYSFQILCKECLNCHNQYHILTGHNCNICETKCNCHLCKLVKKCLPHNQLYLLSNFHSFATKDGLDLQNAEKSDYIYIQIVVLKHI